MTTLHLVADEQRDAVASFPISDPKSQTIAEFRQGLSEGLTAILSPNPVDFEVRELPSRDGAPQVRILLFRPPTTTAALPVIVYVHGGGMIAGTPDMMAGAHADLARQVEALIVSVDYRLAPEAPFPSGLEDIYTALLWVRDNAGELGADAQRISLMGDSGGGGLAAGAALLSRDRGELTVRSQFLLYPMLDHRTGTPNAPDDDPTTGEFVWTRAQARNAWEAVLGGKVLGAPQIGYFSPAVAEQLDGLPRSLVVVGSLDLFRNENVAYAKRLMAAGVATDLQVYSGGVHAFDLLGGALAARFKADVIEAVRRWA